METGAGGWTATGLWHRETGPDCLQTHSGLASWYYGQYVSTATPTCNYNKTVTSGAIPLTFVSSGSKISKINREFHNRRLSPRTIWTTSTINPGPFTIISVVATQINPSGLIYRSGASQRLLPVILQHNPFSYQREHIVRRQ